MADVKAKANFAPGRPPLRYDPVYLSNLEKRISQSLLNILVPATNGGGGETIAAENVTETDARRFITLELLNFVLGLVTDMTNGMQLSEENFTTDEKVTLENLITQLNAGSGLSQNDFTDMAMSALTDAEAHVGATGNPHSATTADIPDSTGKRYVSETEKTTWNGKMAGNATTDSVVEGTKLYFTPERVLAAILNTVLTPPAANATGIILKGNPSQSGLMLGVKNSADALVFTLDIGGNLSCASLKGNTFRLSTSAPPATATSAGTPWSIAVDANYIYLCVATNTWKRIPSPLVTW